MTAATGTNGQASFTLTFSTPPTLVQTSVDGEVQVDHAGTGIFGPCSTASVSGNSVQLSCIAGPLTIPGATWRIIGEPYTFTATPPVSYPQSGSF